MSNYLIELYKNNLEFAEFVEGEIIEVGVNHTIISKNDTVCHVYIILEGRVRIAANSLHESINPAFTVLGENDVFGELSLFSKELASAHVSTLSDVKLIRLKKDKVEQFFEENIQEGYVFLKDLFLLISDRLRHSNNKLIDVFTWGLDKNSLSD